MAFICFVFKVFRVSQSLLERSTPRWTYRCYEWSVHLLRIKVWTYRVFAAVTREVFCTNLVREAKNLVHQVFGAVAREWRRIGSIETKHWPNPRFPSSGNSRSKIIFWRKKNFFFRRNLIKLRKLFFSFFPFCFCFSFSFWFFFIHLILESSLVRAF